MLCSPAPRKGPNNLALAGAVCNVIGSVLDDVIMLLCGRLRHNSQSCNSLVNCRSSGLRVSTAAGSTAAMLSAGGSIMPILSKDLQYMVREPIPSGATNPSLMHGWVKPDETMDIYWFTEEGKVYVDGCHFTCTIRQGDTIQVSSKAPVLKIFLPCKLLSVCGLSNL